MARGVKLQLGSRNVARQLTRVSPVLFVLALAACSSLLGIEEIAAFECTLDGLLEIFQRMLVHFRELKIGIVIAALQ